jgi:hypothetical protein
MQTTLETIDTGPGIINPVFRNPEPITKGQAPEYLLKRGQRGYKEVKRYTQPVYKIYPNRIIGYNEQLEARTWQRSLLGIQDENNKPQNQTDGVISKAANKRIMNAVNWLYYLSKPKYTRKQNKYFEFKVNFITLTLQGKQRHDDKFIKANMLNKFLEWIRYNYGVKSYIWKAEPQNNGNIHFHLTTNIFIPWETIRDQWNKITAKYGYLDEYFKINGHCNANSTDIHSTKGVKKMAAYLSKYMTKKGEVFLMKWVKNTAEVDREPFYKDRDKATDITDEKTGLIRVFVRRVIAGRQWFLSTNLSKIKAPVIDASDTEAGEQFAILQKLKNSFFRSYDYAVILYYDYREALKNKCYAFLDSLIQQSFDFSNIIN